VDASVNNGQHVDVLIDDVRLEPEASGESPSIVVQPQNQTVTVGDNVSLIVSATGTEPVRYQWRFNGAPISDATNTTLTLTNVRLDQAGTYSVTVSNAAGVATSSDAVLTVNPSPQCATPPAGLVGWWRGEGNAQDEVGTHHGTLQGGTTFGAGKAGQAFSFDGVSIACGFPLRRTLMWAAAAA